VASSIPLEGSFRGRSCIFEISEVSTMSNPPLISRYSRRLACSVAALCLSAPAWAEAVHPFAEMGSLLAPPAAIARHTVGAHEMWGQVSELLRSPGASMSRAKVAGMLGTPMRESLIGGDAAYYAVNSGQGRYFDVGLSFYDGPSRVNTRTARAVDEQQACVAPVTAGQDLLSQGWMPGQYDRQNGNFYSFARRRADRGQDQVFLYVTQGCVSRVNITMGA
jgi:hypothetical protein